MRLFFYLSLFFILLAWPFVARASYWPLGDTGSASNIGVGTFSAKGGKLIITGGNVGVNSLSPGKELDVVGSLRATLFFGDATNITNFNRLTGLSTGYLLKAFSATGVDSGLIFQNGSNIGIGTTEALGPLQVYGGNVGVGDLGQNPSAMLAISSTQNQRLFKVEDNGDNDTTPFVIDAAGQVGIGTSDPRTGLLVVMGGNVGLGTAKPQGAFVVNNGNMGIGTWVPAHRLDVVGGNIGIGTQNKIMYGSAPILLSVVPTSLSSGINSNAVAHTNTVSIGVEANQLSNSIIDGDTQLGYEAGLWDAFFAGGGNSTFIGSSAGRLAYAASNDVGFGYGALLQTGGGAYSAAVGYRASEQGYSVLTRSTALGSVSLAYTSSGSDITSFGYFSCGVGTPGGTSTTSYHVCLGSNAGTTGTLSTIAKIAAIGYNAQVQLANSMVLGGNDTNSINVGIATHAPASRLTVNGPMATGTSTAYLTIAGPSDGMIVEDNVGIATFDPFGGKLIVASRNVGVGTLVPGQVLDISGTLRATGFQLTTNPSSGYALTSTSLGVGTWMPVVASNTNVAMGSSPQIQVNSGGAMAALSSSGVDSNGNIGLGTTSVGNGKLMVYGANVGIGTVAQNTSAMLHLSSKTTADLWRIDDNGDGDPTALIVNANGNLGIGTSAVNKAVQVVGGNVGIGTTADAYALVVNNNIYVYKEYDNGSKAGAFSIDWNNGTKQKVTLTGSAAHVINAFTAPSAGVGNFLLKIVQGDASNSISVWPASVKWRSGTAPTLTVAALAVDIVTCYYDGTNYFCRASLDFK